MWEYVTVAGPVTNKGGNEKYEENEEGPGHKVGERDTKHDLHGPYLLIAHSYGGAFARAFVQHEHEHLISQRKKKEKKKQREMKRDCGVLGLVLVETGQEGGLDPRLDERQIREAVGAGER
ncbi:hypothetical protein F5Y09DRAFT_320112 [Xylaria sp. FL1042]|nr:hypothetical protein F5Y09DRAFT_320112 [Xylaria sp. FL1042]